MLPLPRKRQAPSPSCDVKSSETSVPTPTNKPVHECRDPRPQRLHTWFNLIPVDELEAKRPERVLFLDSFVTVEKTADAAAGPYRVFFEGKHEMTAVVEIGIIFVWYGEDLRRPDRPFPRLYANLYESRYMSSRATLFEDTHVMDFVENGSDNLHFTAVDHRINDGRIEVLL